LTHWKFLAATLHYKGAHLVQGLDEMKSLVLRFIADPTLNQFLDDTSAATAIEYGLIAAGISVAIIAVVQGLGTKLNSTFTSVQNALN
jgi:pilus assembly protein Flp/PilA